MGVTGFLSRSFLFGLSNTEVIGLDRFLEVLDGRKDVGNRERGLLTGKLPPIILER
jgi:monolysocardiolipin acyltransferase